MSVDDEKRYGHDYLLLTSISPLLVKEVTWKGTYERMKSESECSDNFCNPETL